MSELDNKIEELKPTIRAILMSLGKVATEQEFKNAFMEVEGQRFDNILRVLRTNFYTFFNRIPDVVKVSYSNNVVILTRVSSSATSHMSHLTVNKYSQKYKGMKIKMVNGMPKVQVGRPLLPRFTSSSHMQSKPAYNRQRSSYQSSFMANRYTNLQRNVQVVRPYNSQPIAKLSSTAVPFQRANNLMPPSIHYREPVKIPPYLPQNPISSPSVPSSFVPQKTFEEPKPIPKVASVIVKADKPKEEVKPTRSNVTTTTTTTTHGEIDNTIINKLNSLRLFGKALEGIRNENNIKSSPSSMSLSSEKIPPKKIFSRIGIAPVQFGTSKFFDIKIYDVVSPSKFTFQYSLDKLEILMTEMNDFYSKLDRLEDYKVNDMSVGMVVAVRRRDNNNRWYRAQIKAIEDEVVVNYFDHLMVTAQPRVSPNDIYHLDTSFTLEPPKSAFGRLFGLKPIGGKNWCLHSKVKVMNSRDDIYKATIKKHENEIYSLSIIMDAKNFRRMFDYMIEKKYGEVDSNDFSSKIKFCSLI